MTTEERLARIENALRVVVKRTIFPYRHTYEGEPWEVVKVKLAEDEKRIDAQVEHILAGEWTYGDGSPRS